MTVPSPAARIAELEAELASLRAVVGVLTPEWSDTLEHDADFEHTITADCDGSNVRHLRRTPRRVVAASVWEDVTDRG